MSKKGTYRIRNWSEYNRTLQERGSLTLWFSDDEAAKWLETVEPSQRGRPRMYSNDAILCALVIKAVYRLPFRALRGFLCSLMALFDLNLPVPCYTRLCRRAREIGQQIKRLSQARPTDIVFDSTGLKVYGEGEWKVRLYGSSSRRTWRKLHLAICPDSHEIIVSRLTDNSEADGDVLIQMQGQLPTSIRSGYADSAYDKEPCYRALSDRGIKSVIPPQRKARLRDESIYPWMKERNEAVKRIGALGGDDEARKIWKKEAAYHTRSIAETAMFRYKTLFGGELKTRRLPTQRAEVHAKCVAMNRMTATGMPRSEWIAA